MWWFFYRRSSADACGEGLVTVTYAVGGSQSEVGWDLIAADGTVVATGGAPATGSYVS